jgi:phosphate starvation-inducible PhoH-like protein
LKQPRADEVIEVASADEVRLLLGPLDSNTRLMRELHDVHVLVREGSVRLLGRTEDVTVVKEVLEGCLEAHRRGRPVSTAEVARRLRQFAPDAAAEPEGVVDDSERLDIPPASSPALTSGPRAALSGPARGRSGGGVPVRARTEGQGAYLQAIEEHDVVLGVGPAGTGKTYLAVAAAVRAIREGEARRIVLVRPAVEAGEKLGFLPGDFQAKVDPYLRPLYDALHDLLDPSTRLRYLDSDVVEVCPLAYMRGRTLNDAFVILDEAQNTTVPQMMMFLTRLGEGSRMVVTGDPSQIDLPRGVRSGLHDAVKRLRGVPGIAIATLTAADVVRHPVVQRIIDAYDDRAEEEAANGGARPRDAAAADASRPDGRPG